MSRTRTTARVGAVTVATGAVLLVAGPAAAHVTIAPEEGTAGSYTVLTASVPHGCDGSPTTRVTIQVPEQVLAVTPTRNPLWEVRKVVQRLDEPVADAHGNEITERVARVVYTTDDPLPEGYRDAFELSLQLPDTPGETLVFPVIQTCVDGETAWVETSEDGDAEELEAPAPTVAVLPAADDEAVGTSTAEEVPDGSTATSGTSTEAAADGEEAGSGVDTVGVAALVVGLLALAVGAAALVTARRRG